MSTLTGFFNRWGERLLRWRWGVLTFISLLITAFEVVEHRVTTLKVLHHQFVFEVLVFSLTFPLFMGVCLSVALHNRSLRLRSQRELEFHRHLNTALANVHLWDELARLLYRSLGQTLPLRGLALLVYQAPVAAYEVVATCGEDFTDLQRMIPIVTMEHCSFSDSDRASPLTWCQCLEQTQGLSTQRIYCLPLFYDHFPIALMLCLLPHNFRLSPVQTHLLAGAAWKIASAIEYLQSSSSLDRSTSRLEPIKVTRSLDDMLDPRLSYLRFKLSKISQREDLQPERLHRDLEQLRQVVNETYLEVRKALDKLVLDVTPELITNLQTCLAKIQARSAIRVRLLTDERSLFLPLDLQYQILHAFQEAMENFERQADGHWVEVRLSRLPQGLIVTITDQGTEDGINEWQQSENSALAHEHLLMDGPAWTMPQTLRHDNPRLHLWFPIPHD